MRQKRSIKRGIKLPVAFHDVLEVSVLVALTPAGGVLLGILAGGVTPPGSLIFPIRFQTRSLKSVPISDLAFRQKLCCHYLD